MADSIQVQDLDLRRVLQLLGLRGAITHEYLTEIIPTIQIASMPDQIFYQSWIAVTMGVSVLTVPAGETWEMIYAAGALTQSAGTVAPAMQFEMIIPNALTLGLPLFVTNSQEEMKSNAVLNGVSRFAVWFRNNLMVPELTQFAVTQTAGDGTETTNGTMFYRRRKEQLVIPGP